MKNNWFTLSLLVTGMVIGGVLPAIAQQNADYIFYNICTRQPGARVNLRTGPGINHAVGLEQVGSSGRAVVDAFRERGYALAQGDELGQRIDQYRVVQNSRGESWSLVGTNQWNAWVGSDFICPDRSQN